MVEITQADREAAASVAVLVEMRDLIRAGKADHHAEAFARHREAVFTYLIARSQEPEEFLPGSYVTRLHADERTAWLEKMRGEYGV